MVRPNPFHEVYIAERMSPDQYVDFFSPVLVETLMAQSLFRPGNVVLLGKPGCGKTMLLSLLKPETRIAYSRSSVKFPVPKDLLRFIGAGINITNSRAIDFSQRSFSDDKEENLSLTPLFFGDFVNTWIVWDLLKSIKLLTASKQVSEEIGVTSEANMLNEFSKSLAENPCWFGAYSSVESLDDFAKRLQDRLIKYRSFLNFNEKHLSQEIHASKSLIGDPISVASNLLYESGVVEKGVEIFIRIDQFEDLLSMTAVSKELGKRFEEILHKPIGIRDSGVSYRIGIRKYAWSGERKIYGMESILEESRHYKIVDIDEILMREENRRNWLFPKFAKDVYSRRITCAGWSNEYIKDPLRFTVGTKGKPNERAGDYIKVPSQKIAKIDELWPTEWKSFLKRLVIQEPLEAVLASAWARQRGKGDILRDVPQSRPYPWEIKKWWRKERIEQALMQIASRNQQQLKWYGEMDVIELSGGNILIFISICQHIWDAWLRDKNMEKYEADKLPRIDKEIQASGIRTASDHWMEQISHAISGTERQHFIKLIGTLFRKKLLDDLAMSYPGHNGFSLSITDLEMHPELKRFLKESTDHGDLFGVSHTSRHKGEPTERLKIYPRQILCPALKIPHDHIKEPLYVNCGQVMIWREEARRLVKDIYLVRNFNFSGHESSQINLFSD